MTTEERAAMADSLKDVIEGVPESSPIYTLAKGAHMVGWADAVKYHLVAVDCHDDLVAALEGLLAIVKARCHTYDVNGEVICAENALAKARLIT